MINILVTGANGQLGSELKSIYKSGTIKFEKPVNYIFTDIDTLDISNIVFLKKFLQDHSFNYVINCAAYTNVDLAETEKEKAYTINANCVKNIVESIKDKNTKFIHISTDYVFDGNNYIPYTENMPTNPQSVYGKSKLEGEVKRVVGKLSNQGFVAKAPEKVINEEKEKQAKYEDMLTKVTARLALVEKKL